MNKEAVLHIPMSQYAYGKSENEICIRIRVKRDDIKECVVYVGDTACRKTPIEFFPFRMTVVAHDLMFDYFEVSFESPFKRIYYYFELNDGKEKTLFFQDFFRTKLPDDRSEYYKLPFNHRDDLALIPTWVKDAVIYNIFPDSFASDKKFISKKGKAVPFISNNMDEAVTCFSNNGGTINGITRNVDYLKDLGINCIYINPFFAAGEYHKYDLLDYFTVDPCMGSNDDFKELVRICHKNGIRVIIDGVFNHVGWQFYAFEDVVKKGEKSKYKDWFYGLTFPVVRPTNPEDYPNYECFAYERLMPKLNTENPEVKAMILNCARFWIEEYDIDGWRLDVASEVNDNLWREFRKTVKRAKNDAFIIGEVWESAAHWMQGDMFDSVMNYDMRKFCNYFFAKSEIDAEVFNAGVTSMLMRYKDNLSFGALNLLDSHDVPRFLTECENDEAKFKLAVVFQMMFVGVPSVFYGDEQGFRGATEPEYRRGMEFSYDAKLYEFYKKLICIRKNEAAVRRGTFRMREASKGFYSFERVAGNEKVVVCLNNQPESVIINYTPKNVLMSCNVNGNEIGKYGYLVYKEE